MLWPPFSSERFEFNVNQHLEQKCSINNKHLIKHFSETVGSLRLPLKATRKQIRNSVSDKRVMWGCNIQVCLCKFEPRLQMMMIQVSHWCFHHLHPKAGVSKPAQCLSPVFFLSYYPLPIFLAQMGLVNTPLGGQSSSGMMKNTLYRFVFLGHTGSGFWTNASSLPEQCMPAALHGYLNYLVPKIQCHFPPSTWSGNPQEHRRVNTWRHWVYETQSRPVKIRGRDPEKICPLWVVRSDKNCGAGGFGSRYLFLEIVLHREKKATAFCIKGLI